MVKFFLALFLTFTLASADFLQADSIDAKVESLIGASAFAKNKDFIHIIFKSKDSYYDQGKLDSVKIVQTLKDNGLLHLFFKTPQTINMSFSTQGSPLFFVKLLEDTLRSLGYYRYITQEAQLDGSNFLWSIELSSEYAIDPMLLKKELANRGCVITDISSQNPTSWSYTIDMASAHLNATKITANSSNKLERTIYEKWLDVSDVRGIVIDSNAGNTWYPYIVVYDKDLHILNVNKIDKKTSNITQSIPSNGVYVKISDLYTLKNIKNGIEIEGKASK